MKKRYSHLENNIVTRITKRNDLGLGDELVRQALKPFGIDPSKTQIEAIRRYMRALILWNQKVSLTTITDPIDIVRRHFGESMFAAEAVPIRQGRLVDVGSDRKSTRLNSSHIQKSRMPSSA